MEAAQQDMDEEIQRIPKKKQLAADGNCDQNKIICTQEDPQRESAGQTLLKPYTVCEWNRRSQTKDWREIKGGPANHFA